MKINNIKFHSGYIITELNLENNISEFNKINLKNLNIYYDSSLSITHEIFEGGEILLLGYCFDIRDGTLKTKDILYNLLSAKDPLNELDYINGRYNILTSSDSKCDVYSDASQLRPMVYHPKSKTIASHDSLLKLSLESKYSFTYRSKGKHTELDYTRYNEIYKFNPSLYLHYDDFSFERLYPRQQLNNYSVSDTFQEIIPFLNQSIKFLESLDSDIFATVTGGIDSRVSAALTRDFSNRVEYLTYTKPREKLSTNLSKMIYRIDEEITNDMKNYLGWNHSIVNLDEYLPSKEVSNENHIKFNSVHAYSLGNYYRTIKKYDKAVHIKSTVFGMGKADFPEDLDDHENTLEFYKKCVHGLPKNFEKNQNFDDELARYFERNKISEGVEKGRHFFDLYHLESRMGNWHSMLTLETDPETEEFIFTNCRKMIDLIQQPSIKDRRNFCLYKMIIDHYWPVLLTFGINKSRKKQIINDNYTSEESYIDDKGVRIIGTNKIDITKKNGHFHIRPGTDRIKVYDQYSFAVRNLQNERKILKISSFVKSQKLKGKVFVQIREGEKVNTYDFCEINEGLEVVLSVKSLAISIYYNSGYKGNSWINIGKLTMNIE